MRHQPKISSAQYNAMRDAIIFLRKHRIYFRKCTEFQIKVGSRINYYPTNGGFHFDGLPKQRERGLDAFLNFLRSAGYDIRPEKIATKPFKANGKLELLDLTDSAGTDEMMPTIELRFSTDPEEDEQPQTIEV